MSGRRGRTCLERVVASRRLLPLVLAVVALAFDAVNRSTAFSILGTGSLDEPAHFATTALVLTALRPYVGLSRPFVVAALVLSVAVDLDHVPVYLGATWVTPVPDGRPFTHSAATILVLLLLTRVRRIPTAIAAGAAFGLATHLLRDICEGDPGVSLFWPITSRIVVAGPVTFWIVILAALALAVAPTQAGGRSRADVREDLRDS